MQSISMRIAHGRAALQRAALQALLLPHWTALLANCTAGQTALQAALMLHWDALKGTGFTLLQLPEAQASVSLTLASCRLLLGIGRCVHSTD